MQNKLSQYIVVILSLAVSWLFFSSNEYFSYTGISLSFLCLAIFSYYYTKKSIQNTIYFIFTCVLASFLVIRAEPFTTFLNFIALIYSTSFIIRPPQSSQSSSIFKVVFLPLKISADLLFTSKKDFYSALDFRSKLKKLFTFEPKFSKILLSNNLLLQVTITFFVLVIIIPLLASVNPIFRDLANNLFSQINLDPIYDFLIYLLENLLTSVTVSRLILFAFLLGYLPGIILNSTKPNLQTSKSASNDLDLVVPKSATFVTVLVFIFTQISLYLASSDYLATLGYSYGRLVNEVFFQLSFVSVTICSLVYFERKSTRLTKILSSLLILECFALLIFAFKSDFDYVYYWGQTHKRLYGYAIVALLAGIYILLCTKIFVPTTKKLNYLFYSTVYALLLLFIVNITNFDYQIYKNPPKESDGVVYKYLDELSTDSEHYTEIYDLMEVQNNFQKFKFKIHGNSSTISRNISRLQTKYSDPHFDLRTFNWSEYKEYQKVKEIQIIDKK
jgi:hypothetical protein